MANLPLDLFYQFALHLPFTSDVLTFSLIHSRVRKVLSTPGLFKDRLLLRGWDVSAWLEEDSAAGPLSPQGRLERWMRIDHIYCRTVQLFDEAAADNHFSANFFDIDSDGGVREPEPDPEPFDDITSLHPWRLPALRDPLLLRRKIVVWLQKLSEVLPVFLTHHRGGNISRITEARHGGALLTYARVLLSSNSAVVVLRCSLSGSQEPEPMLAKEVYPWFERTCFCLTALLIQCDTNSVISIFTDTAVYPNVSSLPFRLNRAPENVYGYPREFDPRTHRIDIIKSKQLRISDCCSSAFLIQAMVFMTLHLNTLLPLRPPSLPYINLAASFSYNEFFEPQLGTAPSYLPLPQARPWLRNRLAGTPLADLLSSADSDADAGDGRRGRHQWAGYYTVQGDETGQEPHMFLELYSVQGPSAPQNQRGDPVEYLHFHGEGNDVVGPFNLRGTCNTSTGVVMATKVYMTHEWKWEGMVTPFGMAGIWGLDPDTGCWWIWPREWSDNPATTGPD